jgi:hypothetical protein
MTTNQNIYYIPIGSFCYPKMIIRETNRKYSESLPFDFNSSPNLLGISFILKELYETNNYDMKLTEIICKHQNNIENKIELAVSDKNKMFLVHFFNIDDLDEKYKNSNSFPLNAELLNEKKVNMVKEKFKKRFKKLLDLINGENNIICFLRIENYENIYWNEELKVLCEVLSLFKHPNKYLIYSQKNIDENLHFDNSRSLNYEYNSKIPIFFFKYLFDENTIRENNIYLFKTMLETFEYLIENLKPI